MGKSLSLSAYGVGAPPRRAVSLIVPHKHTPCPPLGLIAAGHPTLQAFAGTQGWLLWTLPGRHFHLVPQEQYNRL